MIKVLKSPEEKCPPTILSLYNFVVTTKLVLRISLYSCIIVDTSQILEKHPKITRTIGDFYVGFSPFGQISIRVI
jgi:hypothetical protein